MPEITEITLVLLIFLLAGTVKGVIGLGLPTVSLALMTALSDLPSAMALMLLPSLVTNLWQGFSDRYTRVLLTRLWPLLVTAGLAVFAGTLLFKRSSVEGLTALLGLLVLSYALISLSGFKLSLQPDKERQWGVVVGCINGVLTGLTGSFVVPGVIYLQSLGLPRAMFVQSMGLLFSVATLALACSLWINNLLDQSLTTLSMWAVLPALLGMPIGRLIGKRIPDTHFRKLFFGSLAIIGIVLLIRSL